MGINIRAHIEEDSIHTRSVQELTEYGFDIHINGDAMMYENLFGIFYPSQMISNEIVKTENHGSDIKSLLKHMTFYVYDASIETYNPVIDVLINIDEDCDEIHFNPNLAIDGESLYLTSFNSKKANVIICDKDVNTLKKREPVKPIVRRKFQL